MKVYLTRDFLVDGVIKEVEGHLLTGHPDKIQINGVKCRSYDFRKRIYVKPEWHLTLDEAKQYIKRLIILERRDIENAEVMLEIRKQRLKHLEVASEVK